MTYAVYKRVAFLWFRSKDSIENIADTHYAVRVANSSSVRFYHHKRKLSLPLWVYRSIVTVPAFIGVAMVLQGYLSGGIFIAFSVLKLINTINGDWIHISMVRRLKTPMLSIIAGLFYGYEVFVKK